MRKIQRHPAAETSRPPTITPRVPATADTPPQMEMARLRAGPAGNTVLIMASVIGTTKAAAPEQLSADDRAEILALALRTLETR